MIVDVNINLSSNRAFNFINISRVSPDTLRESTSTFGFVHGCVTYISVIKW